jgi:hypothetical protein
MSADSQIPNFSGAELRRLVSAWCDGVIEDADLRRLEATLKEHQAAREMFITLMHVHSRIQGQAIAEEYLSTLMPLPLGIPQAPGLTPPTSPPGVLQMVQHQVKAFSRSRWGWAALVLVGFVAWGLVHFLSPAMNRADRENIAANNAQQPVATANQQRVLARVSDCSEECQWHFDQGGLGKDPSAEVHGGDNIRITKGRMKLTFDNGTVVTLHAPALFQVISDMRARVMFGKVTARVAKGAEGFSVLTPRATVIDLGTEFGIEVNDVGATDLVVFEGEVDFAYVTEEDGARRQRLRTGEGMHLDAQGTASRIVSITDQRYSDSPSEPARRPVITAVRDNIQRDAWNYYEIVQCGMREDAKAFADRNEHEWNGVTEEGMPAYLIGGDYVKTFNNDKVKTDIEVTVKLNRAAKLYVLFDERIPAPEWLTRDFRNTGDVIGVDEGVFCVDGVWYKKRHPGVGAGNSIDHISTIWVRDVPGPASVQLGPTQSTTVDINMYGIVAVPAQ